ncbi:hypothetical protein [Dubosiella newyorkensis]|uniref:hypothetical protein n=1 Tax=Dubosiella newyorkensis TaxID=1862672 RepID=UPI003F677E94
MESGTGDRGRFFRCEAAMLVVVGEGSDRLALFATRTNGSFLFIGCDLQPTETDP